MFPRRIFLSHAKEDTNIAYNIANMLKKKLDIDVQLEKYFLNAGDRWQLAIKEKIKSSEVVIILISRLTAQMGAKGVLDEETIAKRYNVPVIKGIIRGEQPDSKQEEFDFIDFGERGEKESGAWKVAKFLLNKSNPFISLGLGGCYCNKEEASIAYGNTEYIANSADEVIVIGHTLKAWFGDYGNFIRYGKALVKVYFPISNGPGQRLLVATHRSGKEILKNIKESKRRAIALAKKINDPKRFQCYELKIKPMFSIMAVDPGKEDAYISVDHYLYKISSENRPNFILKRKYNPLYDLYWNVVVELIENSVPLVNK